jgi:hypothetical protein
MRAWGWLVALFLAAGAVAPGTAAAVPGGFAFADGGHAAGAGWYRETDDSYTAVVAVGMTGGGVDSDFGPSAGSGAGLAAFSVGCADDQLFLRVVWSEDGSYEGSPLGSAQLASIGPLQGTEYRVPGCDDPDFDREVELDLGSIPGSSMRATVTGQGDSVPYLDTFHVSWLPACTIAAAWAGVGRDASAELTTSQLAGVIDLTGLAPDGAGLAVGAEAAAVTYDDGCALATVRDLGSADRSVHRRALRTLAARWR